MIRGTPTGGDAHLVHLYQCSEAVPRVALFGHHACVDTRCMLGLPLPKCRTRSRAHAEVGLRASRPWSSSSLTHSHIPHVPGHETYKPPNPPIRTPTRRDSSRTTNKTPANDEPPCSRCSAAGFARRSGCAEGRPGSLQCWTAHQGLPIEKPNKPWKTDMLREHIQYKQRHHVPLHHNTTTPRHQRTKSPPSSRS